MGFRINSIRRASFTASQAAPKSAKVPKGYLAVYVGEKQKRFVIPVSYLNQPSFQDLLSQAEDEFGYDHSHGWPHTSLQRRYLPTLNFSLEWALNVTL